MDLIEKIKRANKEWAVNRRANDGDFFKRMALGQHPQILWIGCADSRVPANEVTKTAPGDIFVHRNIANMVIHTDMNLLSVLDYAVNVLQVRHVIVCGHYECGGVLAAMTNEQFGLVDNWIRHIKDVYRLHEKELEKIEDEKERFDRFVELNVQEQVFDLSHTSIVQNAWNAGRDLYVHGWVFNVATGLIKDMKITRDKDSPLPKAYKILSEVVK